MPIACRWFHFGIAAKPIMSVEFFWVEQVPGGHLVECSLLLIMGNKIFKIISFEYRWVSEFVSLWMLNSLIPSSSVSPWRTAQGNKELEHTSSSVHTHAQTHAYINYSIHTHLCGCALVACMETMYYYILSAIADGVVHRGRANARSSPSKTHSYVLHKHTHMHTMETRLHMQKREPVTRLTHVVVNALLLLPLQLEGCQSHHTHTRGPPVSTHHSKSAKSMLPTCMHLYNYRSRQMAH